jgi:hypothetical protein
MAFIDVLEQVFNSLDASTCLNIDVVVEELEEVRIVRDDPSIVQFATSYRLLTPIFTPSVNRIRILPL